MKSKKTVSSSRDRVVYEVRSGVGDHHVEATTTAELREALTSLLPGVEPYGLQAAARLASIERASVITATWSIRRVGIMTFRPDEPAIEKVIQRAERSQAPALAVTAQVQSIASDGAVEEDRGLREVLNPVTPDGSSVHPTEPLLHRLRETRPLWDDVSEVVDADAEHS